MKNVNLYQNVEVLCINDMAKMLTLKSVKGIRKVNEKLTFFAEYNGTKRDF